MPARRSNLQLTGKKPERKLFGRDGPPKGYPKDQKVYADPENWRYPLHTPWNAKAARRYFNEWSNRAKYTEQEQVYIDSRINEALKQFEQQAESKGTGRPPPKPRSTKKTEQLSLQELLKLFLGSARFQRAEEMEDSLVSISKTSPEEIEGKVKHYVVQINVKNRTISHDCEDWRRNMESRNMCKHLGKFLLSLDSDIATDLLRDILRNMQQWKFTAP